MSKTLFTLELPPVEPRKAQPPPVKKHRSKKWYSRKIKHKSMAGEASGTTGGFFVTGRKAPGRRACLQTAWCRRLSAGQQYCKMIKIADKGRK